VDNTKLDLMKRVKMLEFALRQERQVDMFSPKKTTDNTKWLEMLSSVAFHTTNIFFGFFFIPPK
jgi:hypothetical protein